MYDLNISRGDQKKVEIKLDTGSFISFLQTKPRDLASINPGFQPVS